jgi:hypothetical protein
MAEYDLQGRQLFFLVADWFAAPPVPLSFDNPFSRTSDYFPGDLRGSFSQSTYDENGFVGEEYYSLALTQITVSRVSPVPLPASVWLLLAGVGGFAVLKARRRGA